MKQSLMLLLGLVLAAFALRPGTASAAGKWTSIMFNGTGLEWCMSLIPSESTCRTYLGAYANDKLVIKWNDEWNRGSAENWTNPPYGAKMTYQWNGKTKGGTGTSRHYKYVWVGDCVANPGLLAEGESCAWGQFAVSGDPEIILGSTN